MGDLLKFILLSIVEKPKDITIDEKEENGLLTVDFRVAKEDMGKVIGKNGKIIKAIRTVLRIRALKMGKRVNLNLVEK